MKKTTAVLLAAAMLFGYSAAAKNEITQRDGSLVLQNLGAELSDWGLNCNWN